MKTVSAVISSYERNTDIVVRAIKSIQAQTYHVCEIIVVDDNKDGSPYSRQLKEALSGMESVIYVKQDGNKGACAARNLGASKANGEFIGFLDDDDEWCPEKIKKQLDAFSDNTGMVFCGGTTIDENYDPPLRKPYNNNVLDSVSYDELLIMDRIGSTSNPLIRRSVLLECGGFDEKLPARQDYDMWLRISQKYRIKGVNEPLFLHYIHEGEQISKSSKKSISAYLYLYHKYKADFEKNDEARRSLYKRISRSAKADNRFIWLYYGIIARLPRLLKIR